MFSVFRSNVKKLFGNKPKKEHSRQFHMIRPVPML